MKSTTKLISSISLALILTTPAMAKQQWVGSIGYDIGGDTLGIATTTDGGTQDLKANEGATFSFGIIRKIDSKSEFNAMAGYKTGGSFASNGSMTWSALPVEVTYLTRKDKLLLGGGITYVLNAKQKASDVGRSFLGNGSFDNAMGFHFKLAYQPLGSIYRGGVKYTSIDFSRKGGGSTVDGSSIGFFVDIPF